MTGTAHKYHPSGKLKLMMGWIVIWLTDEPSVVAEYDQS